MIIGQQINIEIAAVAFGGDGVARTEEGVLFVPCTAVGDRGIAEVTAVSKNFARGRMVALTQPGTGRTEPVCKHFGTCGGCQYQHLDYETEFALKCAQQAETLRRVGKIADLPELAKAVPSPKNYGYRNKLRLEAQPHADEVTGRKSATYGYYANDNRTFFPVYECPLAMPELNSLIPKAIKSDWGQANAHRKGARRDQTAPAAMTLRQASNGDTAFYFGFAPKSITWMRETLAGFEYSVPAGSFWQINPPVAEELLLTADEWTRDLELKSLIDAYAGVGTFSCALTRPFVERLLIESDKDASQAAQLNLQKRGWACQIVADTTEKALPKALPKYNAKSTLVVLDPPRTGCQEVVLKALLKCRPAAILYISCNAATLARDLRVLTEAYQLQRRAIFDMFPRTAHFESAVLLTSKDFS